jgi:hypothetical protein
MEIQFFLNDNKFKKTDTQPDWQGIVEIDGVPHKVAGWSGNKGKGKFINVKLTVDTYDKPSKTKIDEIPF